MTSRQARPRPRFTHGRATLLDVAIACWPLDVDALDGLVPDGVDPQAVTLDGLCAPVVSAVVYRYSDLRFRAVPFARLSCAQVHYRTYVRVGEERGVWFFGTELASRLAVVARLLWSMPWRRQGLQVDADWPGGLCDRYRLVADGSGTEPMALRASAHRWAGGGPDPAGPILRLAGTGRPVTAPDISDPTVGWYRRRGGGIGRLTVWHPPARPELAAAEEARFPVLDDLGLVEVGAEPVAVLVQPTLEIEVHTPPRRQPNL